MATPCDLHYPVLRLRADGARPRAVDLLEQFNEFAAKRPAHCHTYLSALVARWSDGVTRQGDPLSWRHFRYGMDSIRRSEAQEEYRMTIAARMAQQQDDKKFQQYTTDLRTLAGLTV